MKDFIFIRDGEEDIKIQINMFSRDRWDVGELGSIIEKHNGKINGKSEEVLFEMTRDFIKRNLWTVDGLTIKN